jgi:hypothetical protein
MVSLAPFDLTSATSTENFMKKKHTLGNTEKTSRGFERIEFSDFNGVQCSLQASSIVVYVKPGTSAIWLGCNYANPRMLVPGKSWQPVPMPSDYLADTRMHLDRKQVEGLISHLQAWLKNGTFRPGK